MNFEEPGFLGNRYKDESQTPPSTGWAGIEAGIDKGKPRRKPFFWWLPVALLFTAPILWFVAKDADKKPESATASRKKEDAQKPRAEAKAATEQSTVAIPTASKPSKQAKGQKPNLQQTDQEELSAYCAVIGSGQTTSGLSQKVATQKKLSPTLSQTKKRAETEQPEERNDDVSTLASNSASGQAGASSTSTASPSGSTTLSNSQQVAKNAVSKGARAAEVAESVTTTPVAAALPKADPKKRIKSTADSSAKRASPALPLASVVLDSSAQKMTILQTAKISHWYYAFYLGGLYNYAYTRLNRNLAEEQNANTRQRILSTHQAFGGEIRGMATRKLLPFLDLELGLGIAALEQKVTIETFAGPKAEVEYSYGSDSNSLLVRPVQQPTQATNSRLLFMPSGIIGFDFHRSPIQQVTSRSGLRISMQLTQVIGLAKKGDQRPATEGTVVCPQAALYHKLGNGLEIEGSWRMLILRTGGLPLATQSRTTNYLLGLGLRKTIR